MDHPRERSAMYWGKKLHAIEGTAEMSLKKNVDLPISKS
jgi:hypothetical protein